MTARAWRRPLERAPRINHRVKVKLAANNNPTQPQPNTPIQAVHLADVTPRIGPVSGGTRLLLTGSNLNIGSRLQIFLDDIPCQLDR